ncbi:putative cytoplasmic protein [Caballeronia humi]|uniref:Cytoplasmic protein n=1 Tax=Caballeronia humi TaxID=326474 RepID=A0A158IT45_9BURK|nr:putative cytoplasmic protein [Caballeronia humi]
MTTSFEERLNHVLPRLASPDVLDNRGAGGEIGFWIFDYPPEHEMQMRSWLSDVIAPGLRKQKPDLRFAVIDLFECVIGLLEERSLLVKAFDMQLKKGDESLLASLRSVLKEDRLAARIVELVGADHLDLLVVKGVGAVYPMLRTHTLLSALHPHMRDTPLLMLYPGRYDGLSLRLFNKLGDDNYYRAFRLVS